jgi:Tol biopolymer transport system component
MKQNFGPWSTAINTGNNPQLSTFWRRRLTMLASIKDVRTTITRRTALLLVAGACLIATCPTIRPTSLRAQQPEAVAKKSENAKNTGRIFVETSIWRLPEGETKPRRTGSVIAVDPETGKWTALNKNRPEEPRVSPDGNTLAFVLDKGRDQGIWTCDTVTGENPGRIFPKLGPPIWSPDGKQILATTIKERDRKKRTFIFETVRINADGSGAAVPVPIPATDIVADWSSDGKRVVTASKGSRPDGRRYQIFVMSLDGTGERRLTQKNLGTKPRFSPDGKRVAYLHLGPGPRSIRVIDIDVSNERTVIEENGTSCPNGACWSPNGKELAVAVYDYDLSKGQKP